MPLVRVSNGGSISLENLMYRESISGSFNAVVGKQYILSGHGTNNSTLTSILSSLSGATIVSEAFMRNQSAPNDFASIVIIQATATTVSYTSQAYLCIAKVV